MEVVEFAPLNGGIDKNTPVYSLNKSKWSDGTGFAFNSNGSAITSFGLTKASDYNFGNPILLIDSLPTETSSFLIVATKTSIFAVSQSGTVTDITRTSGVYTGGDDDFWSSEVYQGKIYLTNGVDIVQVWDGVASNCIDLTGIDADGNPDTTENPPIGGYIRQYENHLLLGDYSEGGGVYHNGIAWSDLENPRRWKVTTGSDAGRKLLPGADWVIGFHVVKGYLITMKERSTWTSAYIGGAYVFSFAEAFTGIAPINGRLISDVGGYINFFAYDGFYSMSGLNPIVRDCPLDKWAYSNLAPDRFEEEFNLVDEERFESYWFFPKVGSGDLKYNTFCLVYNYLLGVWYIDNFDNIGISCGGYWTRGGGATWDELNGTWDQQTWKWDARSMVSGFPETLLGGADGYIYYINNNTVLRNGVALNGNLTSGVYSLEKGKVANRTKYISRIKIKGSGSCNFYIGAKKDLDSSPVWKEYKNWDFADNKTFDVQLAGKYFQHKIETNGSAVTINAIEYEFNYGGLR